MPFHLVHQDIAKLNTDAVVNAANSRLRMGGGVCGAIFNAAGPFQLQNACDRIGGCDVGSAVITPAILFIITVAAACGKKKALKAVEYA